MLAPPPDLPPLSLSTGTGAVHRPCRRIHLRSKWDLNKSKSNYSVYLTCRGRRGHDD